MKLFITKYPFIFWFLRENENSFSIDFKNNKLTNSKGEIFEIKSLSKIKFLLFKYIPIFLIFGLTFNKYDFYLLDKMKIMQYAIALMLASVVFFTKKLVIYASFILFLVGGFFYLESVPFTLKYFFLFVLIFSLTSDLHRRVFTLKRNNNTLAHIIILEQDNE